MAAFSDSFDFCNTVLDLDDVSNIGHPCWEVLDPNPDIHHLFKRFNDLFFDGILYNRVNLKWLHFHNDNVGETYLREKIHIHLNINLLKNRLRKEIIEQLLVGTCCSHNKQLCMLKKISIYFQHEMMHAYLMQIGEEDDKKTDYHGPNFITTMLDINQLAKLNITVSQISLKFFHFLLLFISLRCFLFFILSNCNRWHTIIWMARKM